MNRGILALSVEDDAGSSTDWVIDRYGFARGDPHRFLWVVWKFCLSLALLANALFVALVMSAVWTAIGIPAGFSLGFIVAQLGALEAVVGDFLRHDESQRSQHSRTEDASLP